MKCPDDQQINDKTSLETRAIDDASLVFHLGRYSLVNHVIARTRYKKENSIEPSGLDFNKLDRFKSILEGRMLNARDINLYLLRVLLKYYVKMFLYENVTNKTRKCRTLYRTLCSVPLFLC